MTAIAESPLPPRPYNRVLDAPILPTLLALALPNGLAMVTNVLVSIAETSYIGRLGTEPLAAMALVFPFVMLMQMMSSGAMGGGVSSAISRALGAGDLARAQALAWNATAIGLAMGAAFTVIFLLAGPAIFALLGGRGGVLEEAAHYSRVLFAGAIVVWLSNTLSSVLRGTGNMRVPAVAILGASALQIVLGGSLGFGLGPMPRLGMAGVALGYVIAFAASSVFLLWYLASGRARLRLDARSFYLRGALLGDILKVGALACLSPLQTVLTILILTALVARFGHEALAGYGIGMRLEFLLIPIAFSIGVASVPMVGMAIGAGDVPRARRVAWTAGFVSGAGLGAIGLAAAAMPDIWAGFFSDDPAVLAAARIYLRCAGPGFGLFGLGLSLYFASQGAGRVLGPVLAATLRLLLVAGIGWWLTASGAPVWTLFALVGAAMSAYGLATAASLYSSRWEPR
jgi:putative MATE family efflux protein